MYSTEIDNRVVVIGISGNGPAARAELRAGDVILAINGERITSQTAFYRKLWSLGPAGVDVPLTVHHEGVTFDVVAGLRPTAPSCSRRQDCTEHDPEKWKPVFRKDHAQTIS